MRKYGIWHGKDATVAVLERFAIAFLRVREDKIISIFHHVEYGTLGVVYGFRADLKQSTVCSAREPKEKEVYYSHEEGKEYIALHSQDKYEINKQNELIYTMYDGTVFELVLAEGIDMEMFERTYPESDKLPLAKRMALWNINKFAYCEKGSFNAGIDTEKYSIVYNFIADGSFIYCRVGLNGYCDKGRAMLATTCIRQNGGGMLENNLRALEDYVPIEDCFVVNSCAFPPDGGWYWSVKEVTHDRILLNGCGGDTYLINRK